MNELMDQFLNVPKDLDCQPGLTDRVTYQGSRQEEQVLYLYFDMNYTAMKADREILCRAALTRTLTQIEGIDYINIYCGDQPLMDRQGNPVGMLTSTDFIMNTSNVNAYEKTELTLYFADETGNRLVPEKREVVHNINTSLEQLIVEQLIAGPGQEGHNPTLPSDCKILSLSVTDNVCYINFDSAFANTTLAVNEYIPIYSIVDSLSEMTTVTKVQIMINGSQDVMFRDVVSLNTTFERSQNYIDGESQRAGPGEAQEHCRRRESRRETRKIRQEIRKETQPNMKRPLVVLAAGYVLGEVLALQVNTAVDIGVLAWLCAAAAGILWLLDTGRGVLRLSAPKEKMQGRSNRKHRVLLLFLVCLLAGASVGLARGRQEKGILDREESAARTMDGARILVRGEIKKAEQKEDAITLILEEVTAEAGRRTGKFRRVVVYAENGAKGKNGSGLR